MPINCENVTALPALLYAKSSLSMQLPRRSHSVIPAPKSGSNTPRSPHRTQPQLPVALDAGSSPA